MWWLILAPIYAFSRWHWPNSSPSLPSAVYISQHYIFSAELFPFFERSRYILTAKIFILLQKMTYKNVFYAF